MKVRAHLNKGLKYDSHGNFAQSFVNTLYEEDEKFRSAVIVPINEQMDYTTGQLISSSAPVYVSLLIFMLTL